jgi:transposase-like protein
LNAFIDQHGNAAFCEEEALDQSRWPHGFVCPQCGGREHSRFGANGRQYWLCSQCRT